MQRKRQPQHLARIRVAGLGSGGRTAVNGLIAAGVSGVDFLTFDTDEASQHESSAKHHYHIGEETTCGTAGDVERGRQAAMDSVEVLHNALYGSDLVFITAGLGGGTGTGAAPVIAQVAKQHKAVVIGLVTYPFKFEGAQRAAIADKGIATLKNCTDTLIVIPNDRLLEQSNGSIPFHETYRLAHHIWYQSIQGLNELINRSGLINVDFADVRSIMAKGGAAVIATGRAQGPQRAREAAEKATRSELLGVTIDGARGILFNVTGGPDMTLHEINDAAAVITERARPEATVIFGASIDASLGDELHITVVATGFTFADGTDKFRDALRRPVWQPEVTPL